MMTPRGVADVNVYTPERVEARLRRARPSRCPTSSGSKGDTSDNIPGVPGIGDKTAGQLIAQYGSLEAVIEHADELSPARAKNIAEHADQARASKELATMRRDLDIDCDPAQLVLAPPDRSQLKEIFRRFEFRGLLDRVDELDAALPARADAGDAASRCPWREERARASRRRRRLRGGRRPHRRRDRRRRSSSSPTASDTGSRRELVVHDAKALRVDARRRHAARRLPDRARPRRVRARRPGRRVRRRAPARRPRPRRRRRRSSARAATPRRLRGPLRERARGARLVELYRDDRAAADRACSRRWRTPASGSTPTGWARSPRASPTGSRSSRRRRTSSPARSSCSARRSRSRGSCSRSSS